VAEPSGKVASPQLISGDRGKTTQPQMAAAGILQPGLAHAFERL
jgi:hypothetical protein